MKKWGENRWVTEKLAGGLMGKAKNGGDILAAEGRSKLHTPSPQGVFGTFTWKVPKTSQGGGGCKKWERANHFH